MTLMKKWFDQIAAGEKIEEYREIKDYWRNRLIGKHYDAIIFRNGYSATAPTMTIVYKGLQQKTITWESGVTENVFALQLGEILSIKNHNN